MDETRIKETGTEGARIEDPELEEAMDEDLEEIDTIIAELEVSKGRGNLILCVVNALAYRDGVIRVLRKRFRSKLISVKEGENVIRSLKREGFGVAEVLIWTMPEKLTEDLADALNNFRELFYDAGVPSIVFLSQSFIDDVIRNAPDFWRYRGNYYELKGRDRGPAFEAINALATSLHYQNKEDLLRRKRINEYLLKKVKDDREAANILDELGQISYNLGDYGNALKYFNKELKLSKRRGGKIDVSRSLHHLGILAQEAGEIEEARRLYEESLKMFQELGNRSGISSSLHQLGSLADDTGDLAKARLLYEESMKISQELGDRSGVADSLHNLGILAQKEGEIGEARRLYEESLKIAQELRDRSSAANSLHNLGILAQKEGEIGEARRLYGESMKIKQDLGDKSGVVFTTAQLALLEEEEGDLKRSLDLIRQAEALFLEMKSPTASQAQKDRERIEKKIAKE